MFTYTRSSLTLGGQGWESHYFVQGSKQGLVACGHLLPTCWSGRGKKDPPSQLQHILHSPNSMHFLFSLDATASRKPSQTSPASPSLSSPGMTCAISVYSCTQHKLPRSPINFTRASLLIYSCLLDAKLLGNRDNFVLHPNTDSECPVQVFTVSRDKYLSTRGELDPRPLPCL